MPDRHFHLVALHRPAHVFGATAHAQFAVNVAGFNLAARLQPQIKRVHHIKRAGTGFGGAENGQMIAAPDDLHLERGFDGGNIAIIGTTQVDQQSVVGEFHQRFGWRGGVDRGKWGACGQCLLLHQRSDVASQVCSGCATATVRFLRQFTRISRHRWKKGQSGLRPGPLNSIAGGASPQFGSRTLEPRLKSPTV